MTQPEEKPQEIAVTTQRKSLVRSFAGRYGVDEERLLETLKRTAFKVDGHKEVSNAQMMALLVVADQYKLNPFTKEIYAFEAKGGITPVVGVDGWIRIINEHPQFDGMDWRYSEETKSVNGGKECPVWMECAIHRKDIDRPTIVREYLDECFKSTGPWKSHTKRMLRHKTMIQSARVAFGFAGIYDPDEASRIDDARQEPPGADPLNAAIDAEIQGECEIVDDEQTQPESNEAQKEEASNDAASAPTDTEPETEAQKEFRRQLEQADE